MSIIKVVKIIFAIALLMCLLDMPYDYYKIVRYCGFVVFGFSAFEQYRQYDIEKGVWVFFWGGSALLINPFYKIHLTILGWHFFDLIWALALIIEANDVLRSKITKIWKQFPRVFAWILLYLIIPLIPIGLFAVGVSGAIDSYASEIDYFDFIASICTALIGLGMGVNMVDKKNRGALFFIPFLVFAFIGACAVAIFFAIKFVMLPFDFDTDLTIDLGIIVLKSGFVRLLIFFFMLYLTVFFLHWIYCKIKNRKI